MTKGKPLGAYYKKDLIRAVFRVFIEKRNLKLKNKNKVRLNTSYLLPHFQGAKKHPGQHSLKPLGLASSVARKDTQQAYPSPSSLEAMPSMWGQGTLEVPVPLSLESESLLPTPDSN